MRRKHFLGTVIVLCLVVCLLSATAITVSAESDLQTAEAARSSVLYVATFDANGGTCAEASRQLAHGEAYGTLPVPVRTYCEFIGWYDRWGNPISPETRMGDQDTVLYAKWNSIALYTVTFNPNGGACGEASRSLAHGETYGALPIPSRSGYVFGGWYDKWGNEIHSTTVMGDQDVVLCAKWNTSGQPSNPNESETPSEPGTQAGQLVTFNANGGTCSESTRRVVHGETYGTLPILSRSGYVFGGWYDKWGNEIHSTTVMGDQDVVLCAKWNTSGQPSNPNESETPSDPGTQAGQLVTFNANGGTCSESTRRVVHGETYGTLPIPSRSGYVFGGWYDKWGNEIRSTTVMGDQDVVLCAKWNTSGQPSNPNESETPSDPGTQAGQLVTFNANGGTCSESTRRVVHGETYGTLPIPSRSGYVFGGWYDKWGNEIRSTTVMGDQDVVLCAKWNTSGQPANPNAPETSEPAPPTSYTVTFDANGGTCTETSRQVIAGEPYGTLPIPRRTGYGFTGWYDKWGNEIRSFSIASSQDIELTAGWGSLEESVDPNAPFPSDSDPDSTPLVVTFDANGGVCSESVRSIYHGDAYGTLPVPRRAGFGFTGWYDKWGNQITPGTIMGDQSVVLHAAWGSPSEAIDPNAVKSPYTSGRLVTFDANGGTCSISSMYVPTGSPYYTLPTPTRVRCNFDGWYDKWGNRITESTIMGNQDVTLYAAWSYHQGSTAIVTCQMLNVRSGPGTSYDIVDYVYCGDNVEVFYTETVNGVAWGATPTGWICLTYATMVNPTDSSAFCYVYSTFTTDATGSPPGRANNLNLACAALNGRILQPGESFSFNGFVGQRTPEKGYQLANYYVGNSVGQTYGGGVCQIATTIFNSALLGNLQIVERWQHSMTVGYVELGRDATVNWGTNDFQFKNTSGVPIMIYAHGDASAVTITFLTQTDVSPVSDVELTVAHSGTNHRLYRYYNGSLNYTTLSVY